MSTSFLSQDIWSHLTKLAPRSKQKCAVAVAYFSKGASRLLPLPKGAVLVVDASERSVSSGQTCPADLLTLVKRGVVVYSVPNLHAKVFVMGRVAYVGSCNVSNRSANHLREAMVRITDPRVVRAARDFVMENCLHEQTPDLLEQLAKIYRPPLIPGGKPRVRRAKETSRRPALPRVFLTQLERVTLSQRDQSAHDAGLAIAQSRRKHPRSFELDSFRIAGKCHYARKDVVVQVTNEGGGSVLVGPPGNILHVRTRRAGTGDVSFVYTEQPVRRRRTLKSLAAVLHCTQKRLRRDGIVRDSPFAQALLNTWAVAS